MFEKRKHPQHQIMIRVCCELPDNQANLLKDVINRLLYQHCPDGIQYLKQVLIVPNDYTEQAVNLILNEMLGKTPHYKMGPHSTRSVAIPVELDSELHCFLSFEQALVEQITPQEIPHDVMSNLLEEILHTQHYAITWQLFGRLQPPASSAFQDDLLKTAVFLVDEYLVNRSKASIIANMYSYVTQEGTVEPLRIWYGADLPSMLDKTPFVLRRALVESELDDPSDAWGISVSIVKRFVFEPLARDAAFRSANTVECPTTSAMESNFYQAHIIEHWSPIQIKLETLFENRLEEKEAVVRYIASNLESFLEHVGIHLSQEAEDQHVPIVDTGVLEALTVGDC